MKKIIVSLIISLIFILTFISSSYAEDFEELKVEFNISDNVINIEDENFIIIKFNKKVDVVSFYIDYNKDIFYITESKTLNFSVVENNDKIFGIYTDISGNGVDELKFGFKSKTISEKSTFEIKDLKVGIAGDTKVYNNLEKSIKPVNVSVIEKNDLNNKKSENDSKNLNTKNYENNLNNKKNENNLNNEKYENNLNNEKNENSLNNQKDEENANSENKQNDKRLNLNEEKISNNQNNKTIYKNELAIESQKMASANELPKTGKNKVIVVLILVSIIIASIFKIKSKKINDIFKSGGLALIIGLIFSQMVLVSNSYAVCNNSLEYYNEYATIKINNYQYSRNITKKELIEIDDKIDKIYDDKGNELNYEDKIKTGDKLKKGEKEYIIVLYGDVNGDGDICDALDIKMIINQYLGKSNVSDIQKMAANLFNVDETLDAADIKIMINIYLGKSTKILYQDFEKDYIENEESLEKHYLDIHLNVDDNEYKCGYNKRVYFGIRVKDKDYGYIENFYESLEEGTKYEIYGLKIDNKYVEYKFSGSIENDDVTCIIQLYTVLIKVNDENLGSIEGNNEILVLPGTEYNAEKNVMKISNQNKIIAHKKELDNMYVNFEGWNIEKGKITERTTIIAIFSLFNDVFQDIVPPQIVSANINSNSIEIIAIDDSYVEGYYISENPNGISVYSNEWKVSPIFENLKQGTKYFAWVKDKYGKISDRAEFITTTEILDCELIPNLGEILNEEGIKRQIESIEFVKENKLNSKFNGVTSYRDVSITNDDSIKLKAIDSDNNGLYEVAIYSNYNIYANELSNNLFSDMNNLRTIKFENFNAKNIKDASEMFYNCWNLENVEFSCFDNSTIYDMRAMFYNCFKIQNIDLSYIKTEDKLIDMNQMFYNCRELKNINFGNISTKNTTDMSNMFYGCKKLENLDLSNFDTSNVIDMSYMFCGCKDLTSLNITNFDTNSVTDMSHMFDACDELENIFLGDNFNTDNVIDMTSMFRGCKKLNSLPFNKDINTTKVTKMGNIFKDCENLQNNLESLNYFETVNVEYMFSMFRNCKKITDLALNNFNTEKVTEMGKMFDGCTGLIKLDLGEFIINKVKTIYAMFRNCENLTDLKLNKFLVTDNLLSYKYFLKGTTKNPNITTTEEFAEFIKNLNDTDY